MKKAVKPTRKGTPKARLRRALSEHLKKFPVAKRREVLDRAINRLKSSA